MSWGKQKSRVSLRNLLRNKKTAVIAAVCCLAVVGAYIGFHRPTSKADNEGRIRGIINDFSEIEGKKAGGRKDIGSPQNPFVILEVVPYQHYTSMSYMVEDCYPYDFMKVFTGTSTIAVDNMKVGNALDMCFKEEEHPDSWKLVNSHVELNGYYEKVTGTPYADIDAAQFSVVEFKDGKPVFGHVGEGEGDYIWVTLKCASDRFNSHAERENAVWKEVNSLDSEKSIEAGDRYYTVRAEDEYYYMGNATNAESMFRHYNDMMRYSLKNMVHTKYDMDNFSVVVKPIEPQELNENPRWIDYADFIYIHPTNEMPYSSQIRQKIVEIEKEKHPEKDWKSAEVVEEEIQKYSNIKTKSTTFSGYTGSYDLKEQPGFGYFGTGEWSKKQNDISWEVAEKLFLKANALEMYDGSQTEKETGMELTYAPVIIASTVIQSLDVYEQTGSSGTKTLDYLTMTAEPASSTYNQGYNNNFYKFALMSLLMNQDVFYDLFFSPVESTGKPTIQTSETGEGICAAQSGLAQSYWNPYTFLPYNNNTGSWKDFQEKYQILSRSDACNSFLNSDDNNFIWQYTYVYNSNGDAFYLADKSGVKKNAHTSGAFDWYENVEKDPHDTLSAIDIIYYLLNYSKGGNNTTGSRKKASIRVLEIEPSNDFLLTETSMKALFPKSKYKMTIEPPVHMTTAEFNGSKIDLSEYDLVYVGTCRGKMNTAVVNTDHGISLGGWYEEDETRYNDNNLTAKLYLHVGDTIKNGGSNYRLAGTDITKEQMRKLKDYTKSDNVLVFADVLYYASSTNLYRRNVDISTNMNSLIESVNAKPNVVSLTKLKKSNVVSDMIQGAPVSIKTPPAYLNILDGEGKDDTAKAKINGNKLTFSFSIGYPGDADAEKGINMKYGVRLFVDTNGDGIITEAEDGSEVCTWDSDAKTGAVYSAGTKDADGKIQEAQYTINYTIDKDRKNGAIAWKFEVFSIDNENIRTITSGVSRYVGNEDESGAKVKNKINVLQVIPTKDYEKSKANLENELKKPKNSSLFAKYAKDLDDYEITVTTIPLSKTATTIDQMGYLDAFQFVNSDKYDEKSNSRENFSSGEDYYYPSAYAEYGVYLFSCGEEFEKADNSNGAVAFASWLSENGRSVIYTANSIYDAEDSAVNGVAKLLKDSAGLSRYTSSSDSTKKYNDVATYADQGNTAKEYSAEDYKGYRNLEYTYNKLTETGQTGENSYLPFKNETWKKKDGSAVTYGSKTESTETISQINNGTVCVYPYTITDPKMDILDRFEDKNQVPISGYTSQDYQLNLNNPMADVWYCLSGKEDTTYGISPNDAWNNYYLYNVDNVFYDGITLENGGTTKLEMQLFINTLIGAYEASYKYPYITADKLEILPVASSGSDEDAAPPTEDELKIELLNSSDLERNYEFSVSGNTSQFIEDYRYKEYVAGASPILQTSSTPKPTPTKAPPTPKPTQDPDATPVPTATPAPKPITLMENVGGSTGVNWETKKADWMKNLSNDAVIQIAYRCNTRNGIGINDPVLEIHGGYEDWNSVAKDPTQYAACLNGSTNPEDIQILRMTIGEFKKSFTRPVSENDDLEYIHLAPRYYNSYTILLSVRLYIAGVDYGEPEDPGLGSGEESGGDDKDNEYAEEKIDDFNLAATDTHKIFFTPHDGNLTGGNIRAVKLEYVSDKNNDASTKSQPITEVFREKKSGTETKKFHLLGDSTGMFQESEQRYLVDSRQYFIPYNKTYVNLYSYIKMTIWNKKRSSVTYIAINDLVTQKKNTKDVYMFDLD